MRCMRVHRALIAVIAGWLCVAGPARAEETSVPPPVADTRSAPSVSSVVPRPAHGLGHKLLFYLPNRFLDLMDIMRFRMRAGPGLAANARMTMYAANFIGEYHSLYVGLPGPRRAPVLPRPAGRESWKGLMVMGVDATDDTPYSPHYTDSEMTLGAHVLLVGLDVGFDPLEIGDFLAGWALIDVMNDDL